MNISRDAWGYAFHRMRLGVPVRLEAAAEEPVAAPADIPPVTVSFTVDTSEMEAALDKLADALREAGK